MGRCYPQLSLEERRKIADWRYAKMPIPEVADRLGRAASTIYREIKRNSCRFDDQPELNGYHAILANDLTKQRRAIHRKMIVHPELKAAIEGRLVPRTDRWTDAPGAPPGPREPRDDLPLRRFQRWSR